MSQPLWGNLSTSTYTHTPRPVSSHTYPHTAPVSSQGTGVMLRNQAPRVPVQIADTDRASSVCQALCQWSFSDSGR